MISAVIITKNEEQRIRRCLQSVAWADEIVVVDDESLDRTRELCQAVGATVITRRSNGDFDQQRNAGIDAARGEWVLQLDADEVVPEALREEIRQALVQPWATVAFRIKRLNYFLGHPMRHGGWGWHGVKLFKKSAARYVGHSVHETLDVHGPTADLEQLIEHYPFQTLTQFVERQNFYTDVEARLLRAEPPIHSERALRRQLLSRPLKLFWKSYVKHAGYREGLHGLIFAALFAWVHFLKWAKVWSLGLASASTSVVAPVRPATGVLRCAHEVDSGSGQPRVQLSVVVLTKNEADTIGRCLESVRWADELILIDGMSTDRTQAIGEAFGATVIPHAFDGSFANDRNLGMAHAHGEWVLQLDADDVVTPEFRASVEVLLRQRPVHAAFKFRRRNVLLGRVMRHGGWYYSIPNLVRRDRVRYEGLVHERPQVNGTIGELEADVEHHPCENLSEFVARQNRYTSLQADELIQTQGTRSEPRIRALLWRQPWKTFWKSYVKKAGYREGLHGLVFAELFAGVELLKWAKYWERVTTHRA